MPRMIRWNGGGRRGRGWLGLIGLMLVTACGGSDSGAPAPTAPTGPSPAPGGSAVVRGVVTTGASGDASSVTAGVGRPADAAGIARVEVLGTSLMSPVDGQGRFVLQGVPAGAAQLKFSGPSLSAVTTLNVDANQQVSVIVVVSLGRVSVLSDSRNPLGGQLPVNGLVEGLSGSSAAFQFIVNGLSIAGDAQTDFFGDGNRSDSFADLKNGMRVEVKATARDGGLYAFRLHLHKQSGRPSPNPKK